MERFLFGLVSETIYGPWRNRRMSFLCNGNGPRLTKKTKIIPNTRAKAERRGFWDMPTPARKAGRLLLKRLALALPSALPNVLLALPRAL